MGKLQVTCICFVVILLKDKANPITAIVIVAFFENATIEYSSESLCVCVCPCLCVCVFAR